MSGLSELDKQNGVVYTPSNLANYIAEKVMEYYFQSLIPQTDSRQERQIPDPSSLANIRIIDPACGHGELLMAMCGAFYKKEFMAAYENSVYGLALNPRKALCGIDIDQEAILRTRQKIQSIPQNEPEKHRFNLLRTNALYPFNKVSSKKGWEIVKNRFQATDGFDILIANPPWGADTKSYHDNFSSGEFILHRGQFDTSDLFVELALRIVKPGGYFAFIVPDSLFNSERALLRKMLLEKTEIKYIARFGEKIFPNINRACAVFICRNGEPSHVASVDCLRLTPQLRKGILSGKFTFKDAEAQLLHEVPQSRFAKNKDSLFDIYFRENEQEVLEMLTNSKTTFKEYLSNARGVELSKSGKICKCEHCGLWSPYPTARNAKCSHCKSSLTIDTSECISIISREEQKGYVPILTGEDVNRYRIASNHWICTGKTGINYKDRVTYQGPKIIVRKTGVGLLATIDYRNLMTNQVVYIFKCKPEAFKSLPIEFFLAIMNSRLMYYYLVKTSGETEWRSHPYLTQRQILSLPLPSHSLMEGSISSVAEEISSIISPYLTENSELPRKVDARSEYLVASLYGLSKKHYEYIYDTLMNVQQLLPVKSLNGISITDIFGS